MYICHRNFEDEPSSFTIKKSIKKCPDKREHISHQSAKGETNMGSGNAWHPLTDVKYWLVEEQKEEKNYPYPLSPDTRNNDFIFFKNIQGVTFFKVAPFFCSCRASSCTYFGFNPLQFA